MRRLAVVGMVIALAALTGFVATNIDTNPGVEGEQSAACPQTADSSLTTVVVDLKNSSESSGATLLVTATFSPDQQMTIRPADARLTLVNTTGKRSGADAATANTSFRATYRWTVPSFEQSNLGATDDAMVVAPPRLVYETANSTAPCGRVFAEQHSPLITGSDTSVHVSSDLLYIGAIEYVAHAPAPNRPNITVVRSGTGLAPYGGSPKTDVSPVAAARCFDFGGDPANDVTVYYVPDTPIEGLTPEPGADAVYAAAFEGTKPNTAIHEYVHTRQTFDLGPEMQWFTEASAEYYAAAISIQTDPNTSPSDLRLAFSWNHEEAVLTNPETWGSPKVPYQKGAKVLARLDTKIQTETDGNATLLTVVQWMNQQDESISYADFRRKVVELTDDPNIGDWLDAHATTGGGITWPVDNFPTSIATEDAHYTSGACSRGIHWTTENRTDPAGDRDESTNNTQSSTGSSESTVMESS